MQRNNLEVFAKVAELLVGDGLDGGRINGARAVPRRQRERIFRNRCLACAGVGRHKHAVSLQPRAHIPLSRMVFKTRNSVQVQRSVPGLPDLA